MRCRVCICTLACTLDRHVASRDIFFLRCKGRLIGYELNELCKELKVW
jgi:hypothetical protein